MKKAVRNTLASLLIGGSVFANAGIPACNRIAKIKNHETAVESILENTDKQVIMFGEVHYAANFGEVMPYSRDNKFVTDLLPQLQKRGFNYLALELERTAEHEPCTIGYFLQDYIEGNYWWNKCPDNDMSEAAGLYGTYLAGWLRMITDAKLLGMKIVAYDAPSRYEEEASYKVYAKGIDNEREAAAYNNLKELIFDKDPNAKVLVYCGLLHLNDSGQNPEATMTLGYHLQGHTKGNMLKVAFYAVIGIDADIYVPEP